MGPRHRASSKCNGIEVIRWTLLCSFAANYTRLNHSTVLQCEYLQSMNVRLMRSVCIRRNRSKEGVPQWQAFHLQTMPENSFDSTLDLRQLLVALLVHLLSETEAKTAKDTLTRDDIWERGALQNMVHNVSTHIFDPIAPMTPLPLFTNASDFSWTQWWTLCGIGWVRKYPVVARVHYSGSRAGEPSHLVDKVLQVMNVNATAVLAWFNANTMCL
jgi:hypothetical protein